MSLYTFRNMFILASLISSLITSVAVASPTQLTYQGRILKTDGTPLIHNSVSFIFQIKGGPNEQCLIYQEQVNGIDLSSAGGVFDVPIGTGTVSYPTTGSFTVLDAFNNSVPSFDCGTCSVSGATVTCSPSGSQFTPAGDDIRTLKVQFYDGTGWKAISPSSIIRSVPYAGYSLSAQKLGTNTASDFLLKKDVNNPGAGSVSCDSGNFLTWDAAAKKFGCAGVSGASGGTVKTVTASAGSNPYLAVSVDATNPVITLNVGTVAGTVAAGNDPRLVNSLQTGTAAGGDLSGTYPNPTVAKINGAGLSFSALADGQFLRHNGTNWINAIVQISDVNGLTTQLGNKIDASKMPANCSAGQTLTFSAPTGFWTCSAISITEANITGTISGAKINGDIAGNAAGFTGALAGDVTGTQGATKVVALQNNPVSNAAPGNNQVLTWNGSAWAPAASSGGTLSALTGDVTASGSGSVAATVNAVGGSTAANVHAAELAANAATNANTASTIMKRDASGNFIAGAANLNSVVLKDSTTNTVTLQAPTTVTANYVLKMPAAQGGASQFLTNDGSGNLYWSASSTGVTSVAVTSPITNTGTASVPNIGIQQANGSQAGYLASADWTTFNSKLSNALTAANIWVGNGSNVATPVAASGDVSLASTGAFTVTKIQNMPVSATTPNGAGQVLRYNGTTQYVATFLNLSDIHSSVTPAVTAFPATSCTAKQTLTWISLTDTLACTTIAIDDTQIAFTTSRAANTVLAAPSGGAGAASFRTLTAADLPITGATGVYANGGNSFGTAATLGTNDNNSLTFKTNNASQVTIAADGKVGIGTAAPTEKLELSNGSNIKLTNGGIGFNSAGASAFISTNTTLSNSILAGTEPAGRAFVIGQQTNGSYVSGTYNSTTGFSGYHDLGGYQSFFGFSFDQTDPMNNDATGLQISSDYYATLYTSGVPTVTFKYSELKTQGIGNTTSEIPNLLLARSRGTVAVPTAVLSGDTLGVLGFQGNSAAGLATGSSVSSIVTAGAQSATSMPSRLIFSTTASSSTLTEKMTVLGNGTVGIGTSSPTAVLHLKAGTAVANTAPLKLTSGVNLTTPESGAIEFDGTNLYFTDSTPARRTIATSSGGAYTGVSSITNSGGNITIAPNTATGSALITATTASTGSANGALVVSGGAGFAGDIYSAASINAATTMSALTSILTPQLYGSASASGDIKVDGTSHATKGNVLLASAGGKVGIGVSTVGATTGILEVAGTSASDSFVYVNPVMTNAATASSVINAYNSYAPSAAPGVPVSSNGITSTVSTGNANVNANTSVSGFTSGAYYFNASGTIGTIAGGILSATNQGNGTANAARGVAASVANLSGGTITTAYGVDANITNSGTMSTANGLSSNITNGTGTIANAYGLSTIMTNGTGTITNAYALRANAISNSGTITNNYGFYIGKQNGAGITNSYGVYQVDSGDRNYFAGTLGVGTIATTSALSVSRTATATSGVVEGTTVSLTNSPATDSSGTVKAGHFTVNHAGPGNNTGTVESVVAEAMLGTNKTIATMTGVKSYLLSTNSAGTITTGYIFNGQLSNAGIMTTAYGLSSVLTNTGTANVGTSYELYLETLNSGVITNQYGVYQKSATSKNYFAGNVGIGNTSPAKLLHVGSAAVGSGLAVANFQNIDGTCTITPAASGSGIACSSDERLKENFQDVQGKFALDKILKLQAVTYNFKTASTETRRTGYKAQEVQKIAPEFVRQNDDGYFQVYYDAFIPWITESIKTLYSRMTGIEASQARMIASVQSENAAKDKRITQLEQENAAIKARLDRIEKALNSK